MNKYIFVYTAITLVAGLAPLESKGQSLPAPPRTISKCTINGEIQYSDTPCIGAQKIDVEPTRGVDSISGKKRVGADVRREHQREAIADAVRPITGMNSKQFDVATRRMKLNPDAQQGCRALDKAVITTEEEERRATKE